MLYITKDPIPCKSTLFFCDLLTCYQQQQTVPLLQPTANHIQLTTTNLGRRIHRMQQEMHLLGCRPTYISEYKRMGRHSLSENGGVECGIFSNSRTPFEPKRVR